MFESITSLSNPKIKNLVALRKSGVRKEQGVTLIDGIKELQGAARGGAVIKELYILEGCGGVDDIVAQSEKTYQIPPAVYEKVAYGERSDGIIAVVEPHKLNINQLEVKKAPLYVVLENVEKPGNLGAILRTCDGAGVDAVFVCDQQTDIYNPNAIRASLGTIFTNTVVTASSDEVIAFLQKNNVTICATTPDTDQVYDKADYQGALAIAMGEEHKGLTDKWLEVADLKVSIPMAGAADSLNVSVSTAVVLFEAVRQRNN